VNWIDDVGIRPESTGISRTEVPLSRRARVTRSVFLGNLIQVHVRLDSGEQAHAEVPRSVEPFLEGESVFLYWREPDEMRFGASSDL
jgi:ABC-type Fe3+/spermidine/putrescine transport system ATPase subunit